MKNWTIRVVAVETYMGNPEDPLIWHFLTLANTAEDAVIQTRLNRYVPAGAKIDAFPAYL